MIERTILKEKCSLRHLQEIFACHPDWEGVVSNYPIAWHVRLDKGGESLDEEVAQAEAYPDPRVAYPVEVCEVDAKGGSVRVRRASHLQWLKTSTSKRVGDKAVLIFLEGDRSKPIVIG